MACPSPDRILDYVEQRLWADARAEMEQHVDSCRSCRQLIAEVARTTAVETPARAGDRVEPTRIGRYRIERKLGEGGMGAVYIAHDPQLDRRVALKLVHADVAAGDGLERLVREGRALARLEHPNIVGVHDAGSDGDRLYIAMELVEGENLATWLATGKRSWREIARVFADAGRGLAAAHRVGIVHRDVKPENLLIDREGRVKVADFGLASHSAPADASESVRTALLDPASRITHPGATVGTPAYMSPEQWASRDVSFETDQYSLCAALAFALTRIAHPRWVSRVIARGQQPDPRRRFPSMAALVAALDPTRRARRHRRVALAAALPLAIGTMVVVALASRHEDAFAASCAEAARDRDALWTAPTQVAVRLAIVRERLPWPDELWTRERAAMERFLARYDRSRVALCAAEPRTDAARDNANRGLQCLQARRRDVRTAVDRVLSGGGRGSMLEQKSSPEHCANFALLDAERVASQRPNWTVARITYDLLMRRARKKADAGQRREAIAAAKHAVEVASNVSGGAVIDGSLELGEIAMVYEPATAEAAYRDAAIRAEALHVDSARAAALAGLLQVLARQPGREREALGLEPLVQAAIDRSSDASAYLAPAVHQALGIANQRLGRQDLALRELEKALSLARAATSPHDVGLITYLAPAGDILRMAGKPAEARELLDEAVSIARAAHGERHSETARQRLYRARMREQTDDCPGATEDVEAARPWLDAMSTNEVVISLEVETACTTDPGKREEVLGRLRGLERRLVDEKRDSTMVMSQVLVAIGDLERARANLTAARDAYQRAAAVIEDVAGKHDVHGAIPLERLGRVELALGHGDAAIAAMESALALAGSGQRSQSIAELELLLAKTRWNANRDRARAVALEEQAAAFYEQSGATTKLADIKSWLASHRP